MIATEKLESLVETTTHLLRSARSAERLLTALARARYGYVPATPISDLEKRVGFDA